MSTTLIRQVKKTLIKVILFLIKIVIAVQKSFLFFVLFCFTLFKFLLKPILKTSILSLYKVYLFFKKQSSRFSFKRFSKLFLNHYLAHLTVIVISILIASNNLYARDFSSEDFGKNTILFSLIKTEEELIEEKFAIPSFQSKNYMGIGAGVQGNSLIEYTDEDDEVITANVQGFSAVIKPNINIINKEKTRSEIIEYVVEGGDTISEIAQKFNLDVNTMLWENNLSSRSYIKPGDKLNILPIKGISYKVKRGDTVEKIAKKFKTDISKIKEFNDIDNNKLKIDDFLIIPDGKKVIPRRTYSSTNKYIPPKAKNLSKTKMLWPTTSRRITQYYHWRHHGLDIGGTTKMPIYAAKDGKILYSGWGRGYGKYILIDHGSGEKTRYAHFSRLIAKKGQYIKRGDVIGMMGTTGWSTGVHLHFEVIINGRRLNPLSYIK